LVFAPGSRDSGCDFALRPETAATLLLARNVTGCLLAFHACPDESAVPVPVVAEPKTVMQLIVEGQREQLFQLREDIQKVIFLGW
jgi:hypothetical protein